MKRIHYYILGIVVLLLSVIGGTWIGAVNGEVRRENDITEATGNVHASLSGRYEKVGVFIDAIEDANSAALAIIDSITAARTAFADAIANNNNTAAQDAATNVDVSFFSLIALMEDNPGSYSTVGLYSGFLAEFSAATNSVIFEINTYNSNVNAYNTHIKIFPNVIFLKGKTTYTIWPLTNYNATLPTFN